MAEDSSIQIKESGPNNALAEGKSREEQAGLILIDPEGAEYSYALRFNFANSNNDAKYEALLAGLRIAAKNEGLQQAKYLIKEIHMRSCGMHDGPRRVVHKAMNAGYFWPSMHRDANNEVSSWNRHRWKSREAPSKIKYLIVAVDYFTKWIEAKAVTSITRKQLGDEGLCSGGTKLNSIFITAEGKNMTDSQSLEEGVERVLLEFRVTGPQPWSIASFSPDNGHPSPTIISQIENTSRTVDIKPNKRPGSKKKLYPPSLPEKIFAPATQQMLQIQKRSSGKQNLSANREGKHKSINGKRSKQGEEVRLETIVGMIRGNTSKKRPHKQSEQWLDNEISFPSTPGCQLVNSPIILEAVHMSYI
ncbi:hypothetical protein Tco_0149389 [Tanacetum coccineum]